MDATRGEIRLTEGFDDILAARGWSNRRLGREMGYEPSGVGRIRRGEMLPGEAFIAKLLLALNQDGEDRVYFEDVFEIVGLSKQEEDLENTG